MDLQKNTQNWWYIPFTASQENPGARMADTPVTCAKLYFTYSAFWTQDDKLKCEPLKLRMSWWILPSCGFKSNALHTKLCESVGKWRIRNNRKCWLVCLFYVFGWWLIKVFLWEAILDLNELDWHFTPFFIWSCLELGVVKYGANGCLI